MLIRSEAPPKVVDIVYNLYPHASDLYLPNAFIVSRDHQGLLAHIQQKALPTTVGAFDLPIDAMRERLFQLIDQLQPERIVEHFHQGKRRPPALEDLLEDRSTRKAVQQYVDRRLHELLQLVVRHRLPISLDAERKALVNDFVIDSQTTPLLPVLAFRRTPRGVTYRLVFREGDSEWRVREREVVPLTNQPAWIIADYRLYHLQQLNGFLVKPFRTQDEVNIPAASVPAYFRNFIMRVVASVDIEAEGFDIVQLHELTGCELEVVEHLFESRRVLAVYMTYPQSRFGWNESAGQRTRLEMDGDDVRILQVRRDREAESALLDKLPAFGLRRMPDSGYFELDQEEADDDPYALVHWLAEAADRLRAAGFNIRAPLWGEKEIYLSTPQLQFNVEAGNDWLDLFGQVVVGKFTFPFVALLRHIRDDNRAYALPDGSIFLIPLEWMTRYRDLAQFGHKSGQAVRIARSQYTLLADTGAIDLPATVTGAVDDYQVSTKLRADLRPYQLEGVRWLVQLFHQQLGACLADDMGLGKTLQTIALLLFAKEQRGQRRQSDGDAAPQLSLFQAAPDDDFLQPLHGLIVLPASLLYNWENELQKFAPSLTVYQHFGPKRHHDIRLLARFDVVLTTYQTALRDIELLEKLEYEYIILDESQQIKNRESKVFRAINQLRARHRLSLSGTPIENSLSDLWAQMQFTNPGLLGSYNFFRKEFLLPIERRQDDLKKDKLRQLVKPYLLRRTKEEVARDLPPLTTRVFYTEMTSEQRKLYEREKSAARNYLLDNFQANDAQYRILVVKTLTKLRQLVNHPRLVNADYQKESGKFNDVLEQWDVIRRAGHKVLLFSSFVQYLDLFRQQLATDGQPLAWLTGDLTTTQRQREIDRFQQDPRVQAFLISIKTGGTGLNLTAADYVFLLDPWWNPTTEQQAIARAHRIGQDQHVIALKFITRDSIEEKILRLQDRKTQLAEDIIGPGDKLLLDRGDLEFLLE